MKMYLFLGCSMPTKQYAYELSLRSTFPKLGIELLDLPDANCCGTPVVGVNRIYPVYGASRILAIAEAGGLDVLAPCNGCHLSLSESSFLLNEREDMKDKINKLLREEGL